MTAEEALELVDQVPIVPLAIMPTTEAWRVAREALREKVVRAGQEKQEKPKRPTLEELERYLRCPGGAAIPDECRVKSSAAADILKAVREDLVPWLRDAWRQHPSFFYRGKTAAGCLRTLGEVI